MKRFLSGFVLVLLMLGTLVLVVTADDSSDGISCGLPDSDAPAINIDGRVWWDHAHLTIAVHAHPKADPAYVQAIRDAIAMWSNLLSDCFDQKIS